MVLPHIITINFTCSDIFTSMINSESIIITIIMIITIDIITCNDNFDRVMYPPLPVSGDASVIREVAVPDSVDSQLCSIVHHLVM